MLQYKKRFENGNGIGGKPRNKGEVSMKKIILLLAAGLLLFTGCAAQEPTEETETGMKTMYRQITQEEAKEMMAASEGCLIVDVHRPDEFAAGHIPGAVNVPNETIGDTAPAGLPDKAQVLLVYCRSGRRSKEAAAKLAELGYTQVYEFGGILDWTGETVTGEPAVPDASSEAAALTVFAELGDVRFPVTLSDNESAAALLEKLRVCPLELTLRDYGGFEKVGALPWELPRSDTSLVTTPGDLVLYQGNQITIYYGENHWSLTLLGRLQIPSAQALIDALGDGDVTVRFVAE